jgi:aminoglycoside 6'-N-acetyltransferase
VPSSQPLVVYEIRVEEALDDRWSAWFEGLEVKIKKGQTIISGTIPDESALHGVLAKVRDLGLHLIALRRLEPTSREERTTAHSPVLRGERVLLRRGRAEDVERLSQIRSEPEVARWWGVFEPGDIRREFIESDEGFVIEVDGDVVGGIQYGEENEPMYRHAGIDLFLTPSRRGQRLGPDAIRVLTRHLFNERGHHRLTIDPAASNHSAIRAYERVGFRNVGVMRQYERGPDGTWRDGLLMELLRENFTDAE